MKVFGLKARFASAASLAIRAGAAEGGDVAAARRDILARWHEARDRGLTAGAAAKAVGVSKRTLFRWQWRQAEGRLEPARPGPRRSRRANRRPELVRAVEETRKEHPMWGKAKIAAAIAEELRPLNLAASESTVGRILADLVKRGAVEPVWNLRRKAPRAARSRRPWARRRPAGHRPERAGDIVQVDSMTVTHRGGRRTVKQLVAADPVSKWTCAKAYRRATARNAADFLDKIVRGMPFEAEAIQVDGGSEFKAEFELECRKRGIALRVLPPRSPKLNGNVERTVGTWRYEFHGCWEIPDDIDRINLLIDAFADEFNRAGPHRSLGCGTPEAFLRAASCNGRPGTETPIPEMKQRTRRTERSAGKRSEPPIPATRRQPNRPTGSAKNPEPCQPLDMTWPAH